MANYVIGIDFGSDSVRAMVVDAANGEELGTHVHAYCRWAEGKYSDPGQNRFRQHPLDYIEGITSTVTNALANSPAGTAENVVGIGIDTTGSTIAPVNNTGMPLALLPGFAENPNAMFVLWKDHTGTKEADEINYAAKNWGGEDYTKYSGGIYSSEWFWSKLLHVSRADDDVCQSAFSWVEHCDWITGMLVGKTDPLTLKRSRCAAGHKAMWHESWGGLPSEEFLIHIDPLLAGMRDKLFSKTCTADTPVGNLNSEWAENFGLSEDVVVAAGAFDAHMGAVGAGSEPNTLTKVIGTSTCDMLVASPEQVDDRLIRGICGQVDGSILPGMIGLEAGQSAFGDIYAWFKRLLIWPAEQILVKSNMIDEVTGRALADELADKILIELDKKAADIPIGESGVLALDWMNGRRTPDANQALKGALMGLNLGSDAPRIFRALVEATAFGSKKIAERFADESVTIDKVIAIGGIAKKSKFVMQILADVLDREIKVCKSEQACALGAAMFGAVAAGIYSDVNTAVAAMNSGFDAEYQPISANVEAYKKLYAEYSAFANAVEQLT
ncbi:MAG: ribulokinase [Victivallaceae bacterium]|nr:ribulokinase [Victivallaceae bacterium]